MEKEPITLQGLKKIKEELEELKNIKNGVIIIFIYLIGKRHAA